MSIWSSSSRPSTVTPWVRPPRRAHLRRRMTAAAVTVAAMIAVLVTSPANAAGASATLTATVTAGIPAVDFNGTVAGSTAGDTAYVCFGDESVVCDDAHPGTAVDMATATTASGATFSHTYAAEGTFQAFLYEVSGTVVTKSTAVPVAVTIDATARVSSTVSGLTATLDGSTSTAASGDNWWACFGDAVSTCSATAPDASGLVGTGIKPVHAYAAPGTYPASITIIGTSRADTAAASVTVYGTDPTAVLSADSTSGSGSLPVTFNGSNSVSSSTDTWVFCYGNVSGCSQTTPDLSGTGAVALPTTTAQNYGPGSYTATLWVSNSTAKTSATVKITVTNPIAGPDNTCSLSGTTRTCDLFAKRSGLVTAGTDSIPFWGFTTSDSATPVLGGPELVATEGEKLAFTVHNELDSQAGPVSITVPSLSGSPDLTGVAPGSSGPSNPSSGSYTLTRPGTYIYEAGLTAGGARQVAMGLSGVLIVRPSVPTSSSSARCAYDPAVNTDCVTNKDANNYFDREKLVVVNELDADFSAHPFKSDTGDYHPTNYFIDGVAYDSKKPSLDPSDLLFDPTLNSIRLDAAIGDTVLLRYADLGLREHSINLMQLKQTETARDANLLPGAHIQNTEFLNAGETADTFVTIPADATKGTQYPLLDAGFHLNNGAAGGLGGMYSYLNVINGPDAANRGPAGTAAAATPMFTNTASGVDNGQIPDIHVTASFAAQPPSTSTVAKVQWVLDGMPAGGLWDGTNAAPSPAGATTASFDFTIPASTMTTLFGTEPDRIYGDHTIWLQSIDSANVAGPPIGASFTLARRDAVISTLSIDPKVTNGSTRSTQGPVASTKITPLSNGHAVTSTDLNVKSTAGFPANCATLDACHITIGMTITSGPAIGDTEYGLFHYTGLTLTTFTGLTADAAMPADNFSTGSTVALDVVPAGYIAVGATATASLPGWVISASQACVVAAGTETAPTSADPAKCGTADGVVTDLSTNAVDSLVAVQGFIAAPKLPTGVTSGKFWVMARAQEGPDTAGACPADSCRWSPWLYYTPKGLADSSTYDQLTVVTTGPTTGALAISPNPNNGFTAANGNLGLFDSFNVKATATSDWANIALAEAFMDTSSRVPGTAAPSDPVRCTSLAPNLPTGCVIFGQGAEMTPARGLWNDSLSKSVDAFLPLSALQGMNDGLVRVWVHAKDVAGNWGAFTSADLTLDKTVPVVDSMGTPSTTVASTVQLSKTAATLSVASTVGFPSTGSVTIPTGSNGQLKTYAYNGRTATQLLAVTGPSGTAVQGTVVTLVSPRVILLRAHDVLSSGSASGLTGAEWFTGVDPGPGSAKPVTLASGSSSTFPGPVNSEVVQSYTLSGMPKGTVHIRVVDAAGNWSAATTVVL